MSVEIGVGSGFSSAVKVTESDAGQVSSIPETRRTAIFVTGMHRNGTSALARTLSLLGAALPRDLVKANEGNPTGHWEPQGMVDLNDRMLADAGSDVYSVVDILPDWFSSSAAAQFTAEAGRLIERTFEVEDLVVLKDPRTALLAPIWNRALADCGYRVVHVLPLRHPVDVAESLRRRHLKTFPYDAWLAPRGEAVWLRYTLAAVRGSRGHERVFLQYSDLLADWRTEVGRIGRELGIAWPGFDAAAESKIDAFLHGNDKAHGSHPVVSRDPKIMHNVGLVHLASACFSDLVAYGDDAGLVDACHVEFTKRTSGLRDLVLMLEGLYPLAWQYYETGRVTSLQLEAALSSETDLRTTLQRHWAALTAANDDKRRLQAEAGSRDRQVVSLHSAVTDLEGRLAIQAQVHELSSRDDISPISITPVGEAALVHGAEDHEETRRLLLAAREEVAVLNRDAVALRTSTSWRVTGPLRTLSRLLRGRS